MKTASLILILVAMVCVAYSFVKFSAAGLPNPDATSELLTFQQEGMWFWGRCILLGIFASVIGIVGLKKSRKVEVSQSDATD
jgi:hypothetical protein